MFDENKPGSPLVHFITLITQSERANIILINVDDDQTNKQNNHMLNYLMNVSFMMFPS